jgi:hypothetical protein
VRIAWSLIPWPNIPLLAVGDHQIIGADGGSRCFEVGTERSVGCGRLIIERNGRETGKETLQLRSISVRLLAPRSAI